MPKAAVGALRESQNEDSQASVNNLGICELYYKICPNATSVNSPCEILDHLNKLYIKSGSSVWSVSERLILLLLPIHCFQQTSPLTSAAGSILQRGCELDAEVFVPMVLIVLSPEELVDRVREPEV